MELLNSNKKLMIISLIILIPFLLKAQTKGVILDIESYLPIPYVNIHTTNNDRVSGTTSDKNGVFSIDFPFETLSFTHIGYENVSISSHQLTDTVFLISKTNHLPEIVISNKQEEWIERVLNQVLNKKRKKYGTDKKTFSYQYNTYTLNDSSGYAFNSKGLLIVPKLYNNTPFFIDPQENVIKYKNTTAGVDFSNMQRMLYEDFITTLDQKFIKDHEFRQNHSYKSEKQDVIQLMFSPKKYKEDGGYIIVDTASYVILEALRNSGTDFNIDNNTSTILRGIASSTKGFTYEDWITESHTIYKEIDGSYYITKNRFKFYMKNSTKNRKENKQYFTSIESELSINEIEYPVFKKFITLPKPYYILLVKTKKMREEEETLYNIPTTYDKF